MRHDRRIRWFEYKLGENMTQDYYRWQLENPFLGEVIHSPRRVYSVPGGPLPAIPIMTMPSARSMHPVDAINLIDLSHSRFFSFSSSQTKTKKRQLPANFATVVRQVEAEWIAAHDRPRPNNYRKTIVWMGSQLQRYEHLCASVRLIDGNHFFFQLPHASESEGFALNRDTEFGVGKVFRWMGFELNALLDRYFNGRLDGQEASLYVECAQRLQPLSGLNDALMWTFWDQHIAEFQYALPIGYTRNAASQVAKAMRALSLQFCNLEALLYLADERMVEAFKNEPFVQLVQSPGLFMTHFDRGNRVCVSLLPWPEIKIENHQIHCDSGPAISWRFDSQHGTNYKAKHEIFCLEGYVVDRKVVLEPESISLQDIESQWNSDVRSIMIERYGWNRYLEDTGAKLIDASAITAGPSAWMEALFLSQPTRSAVLVTYDPSTGTTCALRVPQRVTTCRDAQAFLMAQTAQLEGLGESIKTLGKAAFADRENPYPLIRT